MSKYACLLVCLLLLACGCAPKSLTTPSGGNTTGSDGSVASIGPSATANPAGVPPSSTGALASTGASSSMAAIPSTGANPGTSSVPEGQLDFTQLSLAEDADVKTIIEFLASLDKAMQNLLRASGSPKLTQTEAARQARILSDYKLQAAERLDAKAGTRFHKELAFLAKLQAFSHAAGLGDEKSAAVLRQLASQTNSIESKPVAHQAAIVMLGFGLSDLAAGLSDAKPVLSKLDEVLEDTKSLALPDFQVCAQTLRVLQQHGLEEAFEEAKNKTIAAFSGSSDPQLAMRVWYLQVGTTPEFTKLSEAINNPEVPLAEFQKLLTTAETASPTQWTLAFLMQNFTNLEFSGQLEKAGLISSVIQNRLDLITTPELRNDAESLIRGFEKRIATIGKPFNMSGLATAPSGEAFDPESLKGKVVLIDFWASWCGPCRAEFPNLRELYTKYHDRGFEIVGVNVDEKEEDMLNVLNAEPLPWIHVRAADKALNGFKNPLATELGLTGIPYLMLIGADGNTLGIHTRGPALASRLAELFP